MSPTAGTVNTINMVATAIIPNTDFLYTFFYLPFLLPAVHPMGSLSKYNPHHYLRHSNSTHSRNSRALGAGCASQGGGRGLNLLSPDAIVAKLLYY